MEDRTDLGLVERFLFEQFQSQPIQDVPILVENLMGLRVGLFEQPSHLVVHDRQGPVRVILAGRAHLASHERVGVVPADLHGTDARTHAVLGDHLAGGVRCLLNIVRCTRGGVMEHELLRRAATHGVGHLVQQLITSGGVLVIGGHHHGVTQRATARQDGDLGDRVGIAQCSGHQRVTTLVVCSDLAFEFLHDARAFLRARDHPVDGLVHGTVVNELRVRTCGQQSGLVHHVGELGAGEARGALGHRRQIHVLRERLVLGVHAQDLLATLHVRGVHADLTVETTRAQQCRIQDVRAVGRGNEDHIGVRVETVHLNQQLVQGLLTLVVTATHAGTALAAHCVDFVHEHNGRGVLLGLLEEVAHTGGTHTHEHLHEVRAGDGVERHPGLAGDGLGEQGLTGTGRAVEQYALGDLGAHRGEPVVFDQELFDLVEFLDGLIRARHIREHDLGVLLVEHLGFGAAELHGLPAGLHAGEDEPEDRQDDQERQHEPDQGQKPVILHRLVGEPLQLGAVHGSHDLLGAWFHVEELDVLTQFLVVEGEVLLELEFDLLLAVVDLRLLDLVVTQQRHTHVRVHARGGRAEEIRSHGNQHQDG